MTAAAEAGRRRRYGVRRAWPVVAAVTLVAVLFLGVFPTRTYLSQRAAIRQAQKQERVLSQQNRVLEQRTALLKTDAEIERLAREQYNLVRPGEEAYAVLPPPPKPLALPDAWPFQALHDALATPVSP